jgi:FtsZ-binding cell division protein ZapB
MKYEYRRETTPADKIYNLQVQLAEARDENQRLQERAEWLRKERDRLLSRVWSLKKTRAAYAPRQVKPRDEGHARLIAAIQEAYKPRREA